MAAKKKVAKKKVAVKKTTAEKKVVRKSLGTVIDSLYKKKEEIKKSNNYLSELKHQAKEIEDEIFELLRTEKVTSSRGRLAQATISEKEIPVVDDWPSLHEYINHTGELDLLNKALNTKAVRERWAEEAEVPGVGTFTKTSLSLTKVKA